MMMQCLSAPLLLLGGASGRFCAGLQSIHAFKGWYDLLLKPFTASLIG